LPRTAQPGASTPERTGGGATNAAPEPAIPSPRPVAPPPTPAAQPPTPLDRADAEVAVTRPISDTSKRATSRRERHRGDTAAEGALAPLGASTTDVKPTEPRPIEPKAAETAEVKPFESGDVPKLGEAKLGDAKPSDGKPVKAGGKTKKKADQEEDPDATMAPSD
jgi:hypothetical protein